MPASCLRSAMIAFVIAGTLSVLDNAAADDVGTADAIDFARQIRPILAENCFHCHGPDAAIREAGLRLDTESDVAAMLVAGDRDASELFRRLATEDETEVMPPPEANRSLTAEQIEAIGLWIDQGARWGGHWAFMPLIRPGLPDFPDDESAMAVPSAGPIDRFVAATLRDESIEPAEPASASDRLRRVSLDLTGLPPSPDQLDRFLADPSPAAYRREVDRLLQSPAFGERMAWDWLDVARYADSNGYQGDGERTMWPWRDWVVDAFNRNLPYDDFTLWQIAGDLLPDATPEQRLASGFFRNHMINGEGGRIAEENRVEYVFDMTETFGTAWLGLTLNCCRCHDHKFDPLTHQDYFRLFAYFNQTPVNGGGGNPQTPPIMPVPDADQQQQIDDLKQQIAAATRSLQTETAAAEQTIETDRAEPASETEVDDTAAQSTAAAELETLNQQLTAVESRVPKVMIMGDRPDRRDTFMLEVGLYNKPGDRVDCGVPEFLPGLPDDAPADRLGLARWLIADTNPLMARVTVNRFWQSLFGIGLVKTPEDFGVQGEIPRYQALLDWLAADFRDHGWDVKRLIRQIVTSDVYQQSSRVGPDAFQRDPENRWLARGPRSRLPAWMLRDQALSIAGLLSPRVGGRPVNGYQPEGIWEEATFGKKKYVRDQGESLHRRTLYTFWRRIVAPTMLFDQSPRQVCAVTPRLTNTPLHALVTLNETAHVEAARVMAERVLDAVAEDDRARIDWAFRAAVSRPPADNETAILLARLKILRDEFADQPDAAQRFLSVGDSPRDQRIAPEEQAAWAALCSLILNLDETISKP